MASERLTKFLGKVKNEVSEWQKEGKLKDVAEPVVKGVAVIAVEYIPSPVLREIIKNVIDRSFPDGKEKLLKEIKELSESQFKEISGQFGFSFEILKGIRKETLSALNEILSEVKETKEDVKEIKERLFEISIPTIQSVLKKGVTSKGDFFKIEPEWIDFEEGFIVEREEVDEIIRKLESNNIQLVLGDPASGKSVILKNIGFRLATKECSVYIIELKKWSEDRLESYFKEAQEIDDGKTLIIVDDAHLQLFKCEALVRDFKYKKLRTKLIIGTREVKELEEGLKRPSEFENLVQTKIFAIDATEKMIHLFLKKKHGVSDEQRIENVSKNLEGYKDDLWNLSWSLETYDKDTNTVRKEEIYSAINECITNIKISEEKTINAEDIFLPLSIFYKFEIAIEKRFLTKILKIDECCIDDLISISEVHEIKERGRRTMLSLHHSSLASLYFETYQRGDLFPELGENIKEEIVERSKYDDLEHGLFYLYMISDPTNTLDVLMHLAPYTIPYHINLAMISHLHKKLIRDKKIEDSIKKAVEKEEDIEKIGHCVIAIARASEEVGLELANGIDIGTLSSKIEKEEDIEKIGLCVFCITRASKEVGLELANNIDISTLSSKIEKEEDIEKIGQCVMSIADAIEEVALELANSIDIGTLSSKIEKEEDIEKIGQCMMSIADASEEVALELSNNIDIGFLSSKIEKEEDILKIGWCVIGIAEASEEVALELVDSVVSSKIEKEEDILKIQWCVSGIARTSKEVAHEIVNHLNPKLIEELQNVDDCGDSK